MRLPVGRKLRVVVGDTVIIRATLPAGTSLGRLFVFACEQGNEEFSPYVLGLATKLYAAGNEPSLMTPLSIRLTSQRTSCVREFVADIDGHLQVMQELDTAREPKVPVRISRRIAPQLPWTQRIRRQFVELWA